MSVPLRLIPILCLFVALPAGAAAAEADEKLRWAREAATRFGLHLTWPDGTSFLQKLRASVAFSVDKTGVVSGVKLVRKTGSQAADRAALAAVNAASPLPAPPLPPDEKTFTATMPVMFALAEDVTRWTQAAAAQIRPRLTWPKGVSHAKKMQAAVAFTVDRAGSISGAKLVRTTGTVAADRAALLAVNAASPLPAPPLPPEEKAFPVTLPVTFSPDFAPGSSICDGC